MAVPQVLIFRNYVRFATHHRYITWSRGCLKLQLIHRRTTVYFNSESVERENLLDGPSVPSLSSNIYEPLQKRPRKKSSCSTPGCDGSGHKNPLHCMEHRACYKSRDVHCCKPPLTSHHLWGKLYHMNRKYDRKLHLYSYN